MLASRLSRPALRVSRCGTKLRLPFKTDSIASRISSTPLFRYQSTAPSKPPTPTTTFLPASSSTQTLASQRLLRPTSPNLGIYALSINYVTSPLNRITGSLLAGSFYIFGFTYLVAPYLGFHVDVNGIAEAFGGLDGWVKGVVKFGVAWPFVFHAVNGVGHLIWDTGRAFARKSIVRQGWTVVGVSVAGALGLATML